MQRSDISNTWRRPEVNNYRDTENTDANLKVPRRSISLRSSHNNLSRQACHTMFNSGGESHPDTLQAIAEGRRLYVGNLLYMAKVEDVKEIFDKSKYQM